MWKSARAPFEACGLGSVGCGGQRLVSGVGRWALGVLKL